MPKAPVEILDVDGVEVRISNPRKVFFPDDGFTKMDLVEYYLAVADGAVRGCRDRPVILHRFPNGIADEAFYQKRVPQNRPEWIQTTTVHFPSGRSAEMLVITDTAHLLWAINLGCIDLNPWPVRRSDVDHPDELRVDLDPTPEVPYSHLPPVAALAKEVLEEHGLRGYPKTSGKRGMHVYARIEPRWDFTEVRRAALALAREVERRSDGLATTAWWKEERHGVFVDYNQNARDRTIASAYSVRPLHRARVSCPFSWDELDDLDPQQLRLDTVPKRYAEAGDPAADIDDNVGSIEVLLNLARRDEEGGLGDAPWPPHFPKAPGEPPRVEPSKRRS